MTSSSGINGVTSCQLRLTVKNFITQLINDIFDAQASVTFYIVLNI